MEPFLNPTPYIVPKDMSLTKVYSLFRQLGLRHICVVPRRLVYLQTVLFVGMKLQQIITSFALDVMGGVEKKNSRKRGSKRDASVLRKNTSDLKLEKIHPIKPHDDLLWFHRPKLLLYLVHFMLLQNAFEFAFLVWGLRLCLCKSSAASARCLFTPLLASWGQASE